MHSARTALVAIAIAAGCSFGQAAIHPNDVTEEFLAEALELTRPDLNDNTKNDLCPDEFVYDDKCFGKRLFNTLRAAGYVPCSKNFNHTYFDYLCDLAMIGTDHKTTKRTEELIGKDSMFIETFYDGGTDWNQYTQQDDGKYNLAAATTEVRESYTNHVLKNHVLWPWQQQFHTGRPWTYVDHERSCVSNKCNDKDSDCCAPPDSATDVASCRMGLEPSYTGESCNGQANAKFECCTPYTPTPPTCELNAVMCCYARDRQANDAGSCKTPYDVRCVNRDPADNTDICKHDLSKSASSNHLDGGIINFPGDVEGRTHCHGLGWDSDDATSDSYRFAGNTLYHVSLYDHLTNRGYVENIPGAPLCGCLEDMPQVSRADCTRPTSGEEWVIKFRGDKPVRMTRKSLSLSFLNCNGVNDQKNNLEAYYKLPEIGGPNAAAKIAPHVVGQCDNA